MLKQTQIDYKAFRFCLASEYSIQVIKTLSLNDFVCFIVFLLFVYEKKEGVCKNEWRCKTEREINGHKRENMNQQSVFLLSEIESRVRPSLRHCGQKLAIITWKHKLKITAQKKTECFYCAVQVRIRWRDFFCRNICSRKSYSYASVLCAYQLL